jgi:hypothetical protein
MQGVTKRNLRSVSLNLLVALDALMTERNVTRAAHEQLITLYRAAWRLHETHSFRQA